MKRKIQTSLVFLLILFANAMCYGQTTFNTQRNYAFPNESSPVSLAFLNEDINDVDTIYIENGHFYRKGSRYRFFGTNIAKDGNFPEHEESDTLAEQLAALGVNCVRLHFIDFPNFFDNNSSPFKSVFRYYTSTSLSTAAMDKLDYLIFKLKEKGIYINLNLHTAWNYMDRNGHSYSYVCNFPGAFPQGKGLDQWVPDLIDMQKEYYSIILNHYNTYTKKSYKDDPALAMVEINNESSSYKDLIQDKELPKLRDLRSSNSTIAYLDSLFTQKWRDFLSNPAKISVSELQNVWGTPTVNDIDLPYDISKTAVDNNLKAKRRHFGMFLRDIEDAYYSEIVSYIKNDIGLKRPLTGGQLDWGFWSMEKHFDYTDQHTYYTYGVPAHFKDESDPRPLYQNSWWRPQNLPLITAPEDDHWNYMPFIETFASKIKNKPHTISEFNMGYGGHYHAEAPLSFATMAKLQDSDAIFIYGHIVSRERTREDISLEVNSIPTMLVQYLPIAYLFRNADINPLSGNDVELPLSLADELKCVETIRRTSPYAATPGFLLQEEPLDFAGQDKAIKYPDTYRFPLDNLLKNKIVTVVDNSDNSTVHNPTSVVDGKAWSNTDSRVTFNNDGNHANKNNYLQFHDGSVALYMGWNTSLGTSGKGNLGNVSIQSVSSYNGHFVFSIFNKDGDIGDEGTYIIQLLNGAKINPLEYRIVDFTQLSMSPDVINTYQKDNYWNTTLDPYLWIYCNTTFATTDAAINTDVEALDGQISLNLNSPSSNIRLYPLHGNTGAPLADIPVSQSQNLTLDLNSDEAIMYVLEVGKVNSDTEAPTAPANLDTANVTTSSVDLTWGASTDNVAVTGYKIYQNSIFIKEVTQTTYTVPNLSAGDYEFYIKAVDAAGNISDPSNTVSVTIDTAGGNKIINVDGPEIIAPGQTVIVNVTYTSTGDNDVVLIFQKDSPDWDVYVQTVDNVTAGTGTIPFQIVIPETTSVANNEYQYQAFITPRDGSWDDRDDNMAQTDVSVVSDVDTEAPTAPGNLTASNITTNSVDLSWIASTDNVAVTGYTIYEASSLINDIPVSASTTTYTVPNLSAGNYNFYVKAVDAAGNNSDPSNSVSETIGDNPIIDTITSINVPNSITRGTTINVDVEYSATVDRDIEVVIQQVGTWIEVGKTIQTVAAGSNRTEAISVNINGSAEINNNYMCRARMYPVGQTWPNNIGDDVLVFDLSVEDGVTPVNRIANPSFEFGSVNWLDNITNGVIATMGVQTGIDGNGVFASDGNSYYTTTIIDNTTNVNYHVKLEHQNITLENDKNYRLMFDVLAKNTLSPNVNITFVAQSANWQQLIYQSISNIPTNTWGNKQVDFSTDSDPSKDYSNVYLRVQMGQNINGANIYLDNFELYEVTVSGDLKNAEIVSSIFTNNENSNAISIYPNPVSNEMYLENATDGEIIMYNTVGKIVLHKTYKAGEAIDVSTLNKGLYLLKFKGEKNASFKILK